MQEHVVAKVEEMPPGSRRCVRVGKRFVTIFRCGDDFYSLHNRCQHKGGSLVEGILDPEKKVVRCPWHLWDWDLETGCLEAYPKKRVPAYEVRVVNGEVRLFA